MKILTYLRLLHLMIEHEVGRCIYGHVLYDKIANKELWRKLTRSPCRTRALRRKSSSSLVIYSAPATKLKLEHLEVAFEAGET